MEDWRKQLPGMYKQVTEIKIVQELYDDIEFMEYTADWVDRILNKSTASEQSAASEQTTAAGEQKNSTTAESGVRYLITQKSFSKAELVKNINDVHTMDSVIKLPENAFKMGTNKAKAIDDLFASWNNNIYSEELGDIALTKGSRKSELGHGTSFLKNEAYLAIPNVLQQGKVVFQDYENERKNSERLIVIAPIKISNDKYYMGIQLKRSSQTQQLYIHDVILEEEVHKSTGTHQSTTGAAEDKHLFFTTIIKKLLNVKKDKDIDDISLHHFQISDTDYMQAARKGDEAKAAVYVEQAAKEWGAFSDGKPEPINLYHGTMSFGFTEFDLKKMDDKGIKKALTSN